MRGKSGCLIVLCWESVTGQRSNQLNYVPNLFSSGFGKPLNFLFIPTAH